MMTNLDEQEWQPKWVFLDGVGWWPYGDLDLDDYERELEESIARGEWRSVPNFEEEKERAREIARNTMASWSEEKLAEVRRRVEAMENGVLKPPPHLAGNDGTGDNSPASKTHQRPPGGITQ